jgi:hypothetical protein
MNLLQRHPGMDCRDPDCRDANKNSGLAIHGAWIYARLLPRTLRAGFAVRSGILPTRSAVPAGMTIKRRTEQ